MQANQNSHRLPNHREGANLFSIISFGFTLPTFRKGFKKDLEESDITQHLPEHDSKILGDKLEAAWNRELKCRKKPSLYRAVIKVFGFEFFILGIVTFFLELVVKMSQPLALSQLIKYYSNSNEDSISKNKALMYAGLIVAASFINVLTGHSYIMALQHFGMKLRVAFCSLIYRKSLRLSKSVLEGTTIGQMVNLLSNDVNRCDRAVINAHNLWLSPIEVVIIVVILSKLLGLTSTAGIVFMAFFVPLEMYLGKLTSVYRLRTALKTDERIRFMNEIISGIQVIKMYTWEKPFARLVQISRSLEIQNVTAASYIRGIIISFSIFVSKVGMFISILTYVLLGNTPVAEYVFVVSSFYNLLRLSMTMYLPRGIADLAEFNISVSRLEKFLLYEEIEMIDKPKLNFQVNMENKISRSASIPSSNGVVTNSKNVEVGLLNVSVKWKSDSVANTLDNIDFHAKSEQLTCIIGPVGSGKTSLLHVILRELPIISGNLLVQGTLSYASQEPWIFSGNIKQNILFGEALDQNRYAEVVKACALTHDLMLLPYGDETFVGEKGVTLSGGQRARISLARAVYKKADIYLLDDPLSAVDAHVGRQLCDECICGFLKAKCTILVTHQLQYIRNCTCIYLLENGRVSAKGSYNELKEFDLEYLKQLHNENGEEYELYGSSEDDARLFNNIALKDNKQEEIKELRSSGSIARQVYGSYLKAGGPLIVAWFTIFLFILTQACVSSSEYFLSYWVNLEQEKPQLSSTTQTDSQYLSRNTSVYIYTSIVLAMVILTLYRSYYFFKFCMKASSKLHDHMFSNIVQAPMRFFDTNPSGRILNRFSKDIGAIDEVLPVVTLDCLQIGLSVIGITCVVSLVNPWLLIVTVIIFILFYLLRIFYMRTSRSIKRLESITRSPVFTHMNASLQGLTTIRAFGTQYILQREFDNYQDLHSSVWYLFLSCSRAFGFWLDLICVFYIGVVTFSFFFMGEEYGGNVGLAITQSISLTGMFQWGMRQWTELENQMTSVERVVEYTNLQHEDSPSEIIPSANWPEEGAVDFLSVSLRYSSIEPYVLKKLEFSIRAKDKIGIVGRTGAGKSSIINALFQLTPTEGSIIIDNIDISKIPLHSLRSKISIIPQEPVLFSGSLRKNLDPFNEYEDTDLWKALEKVELKHVVNDLPAGLNSKVSEGGANFSVGQRQLLCLARAIIRNNKVLILDEATANVDPQTDELIQKTIRTKFRDCTVLTVAHRLHTIMDSDKILVMSNGCVVEYDHPHILLRNNNTHFYKLVQKAGQSMAENLARIAEKNYEDNILSKRK